MTLGLHETWTNGFDTWLDALNHLTDQIENAGIITVLIGVVENNSTRKIPVESCRGFVLVDEIAPFMFINNSDSKAAQMFTLVHELAHIWIGKSAGFDFRQLQPAQIIPRPRGFVKYLLGLPPTGKVPRRNSASSSLSCFMP